MQYNTLFCADLNRDFEIRVSSLQDGSNKFINIRELTRSKVEPSKVYYNKYGFTIPYKHAATLLSLLQKALSQSPKSIYNSSIIDRLSDNVVSIIRLDEFCYLVSVKKSKYAGNCLYLEDKELGNLVSMLHKVIDKFGK